MKIKKLFLILSCVFFLGLPLHSQSQSQSLSQALDEQILNLSNFQIDFQKMTEDLLQCRISLVNVESQLKESLKSQKEAMELSQELSKALDKSEMKSRLWKNAFIISTTVAVITTGTTIVLLCCLNK